jgi:RimJ/RimL family protein N-acetyltransferase
MNPKMNIETERLILRRWRPSDSEPYSILNSNSSVMEFLLKPLSRDESDAMIARAEAHFDKYGYGPWAVEIKSSGEFIGFTGLSRPTFEMKFIPCVEVGWRLARAAWGNGYATEADRAISLYKKYGFVEEGRHKRDIKLSPNQYIDTILMGRFVK